MEITSAVNDAVQPQHPLRLCVECQCGGSSREMGLAQGKALRTKILDARRTLRRLEAFRLDQPLCLPYPLFLRLAEWRASEALKPALRQEASGALARLTGIAEGATRLKGRPSPTVRYAGPPPSESIVAVDAQSS